MAPGVIDGGRCLSWILQKPGSIPERFRTVIGDRIYGCDDCQDVCPITVRLGRRNTVHVDDLSGAVVDVLRLLDADDAWIEQRVCPLVRRRSRLPVGPAERARRRRQRRRSRRQARVAPCSTATVRAAIRSSPNTPRGPTGDSTIAASTLARPTNEPTYTDEAPSRHERLPTQDRRHPVAAVGVVAPPPADRFAVLTSPHADAAAFDADQPFRIERTREPVLLPHPFMVRQVNDLARDFGADLVVLDPAVPLGLIGPSLELPYDLVLHGAEVTVPGRLPRQQAGARVHARAGPSHHRRRRISGRRSRARRGRELPITVVPCGVDAERFRPLEPRRTHAARAALRHPATTPNWSSASRGSCPARDSTRRSGPRPASAGPPGSAARDRRRRTRRRPPASDSPPNSMRRSGSSGGSPTTTCRALYGCADVFTMLCRNRWDGLEQEGFGIVFVEAAACGVPQVAGASGGAAEAVVDGVTGLVIDEPEDVQAVADAFAALLDDPSRRAEMGTRVEAPRPWRSSPTTCCRGNWARPWECSMTDDRRSPSQPRRRSARRRRDRSLADVGRHRRLHDHRRDRGDRLHRPRRSGSERSRRCRCSRSACSRSCGRSGTSSNAAVRSWSASPRSTCSLGSADPETGARCACSGCSPCRS